MLFSGWDLVVQHRLRTFLLSLNFPIVLHDSLPEPIYYSQLSNPELIFFKSHSVCFLFWFSLIHLQPPQDILSEESDTASVTSSMASPKMERKFKKTKYNVQARIDTNLTPKRKEKVAKSSAVATPRLRLTTPIPYNASRSRDPSPARGAGRSREPSPARNANR